jgi:hypothetical protein
VPCNGNVYNTAIDSPFDIYPHWRRADEFLKENYDMGLLKITVF